MTKATMMNALLCISVFLIMNHQSIHVHVHAFTTTSTSTITSTNPGTTSTKLFAGNARQNEIRRKIMKLKKAGKINNSDDDNDNTSIDEYADKISAKMGKNKSKLLSKLKPELGEAIMASASSSSTTSEASSSSSTKKKKKEKVMYDEDNDVYELDEQEEEMLELVQQKMIEKEQSLKNTVINTDDTSNNSGSSDVTSSLDDKLNLIEEQIGNEEKEEESQLQQQIQLQILESQPNESIESIELNDSSQQSEATTASTSTSSSSSSKKTSGIGGSWEKPSTSEDDSDLHKPANGGWGYFPRPKNISETYGGGKRIERTSTVEDERRKQKAVENTRDKLRAYREKVGIEVQSEKDHAKEIEEALALGQLAMQRGVYNTAVSALEKVTKYCSTNSKVGGQVFLELAMAYEAVGRTTEAIQVYAKLSDSRMEDIKFNAKKLLYGIESMKFMREEVKSEAFSRKQAKQTFIETTGLANIAQNFDEKIYNTAYIDLDKGGGFYRKLTENVVRSMREARQILLKATGSGEVERVKIIQALRTIDRKFTDALAEEIKRNKPKEEPVAMMNGVPIIRQEDTETPRSVGMDSFNLGDADQMLENVSGEWKLQLMADSKGDGVKFFNKTVSWQYLNTDDMSYDASGPSGFLKVTQSGKFEVDEKLRIITRKEVKSWGSGAFFTNLSGSSRLSGAMAATNLQQQIVSVDSEILITRAVTMKKSSIDTVKDYFCVWRRAETGMYSEKKQ